MCAMNVIQGIPAMNFLVSILSMLMNREKGNFKLVDHSQQVSQHATDEIVSSSFKLKFVNQSKLLLRYIIYIIRAVKAINTRTEIFHYIFCVKQ
eukprot:snap_masked-scaffold_10-processed-gene-12.27-mRNA-1 protein AED:1.00 eAED:1.00 QI:0/0/0/0/1/1/5/0/93